jgi:hypothetical protein
VRPQHVFGEHGGEMGRSAKIWAARPIWLDGSNHGQGGGIWLFLGSPVPTSLRLDCLLPLTLVWRSLAAWGPASLANNGGGPRIPSIAKMMICQCLSPSIWRKWRVPKGSAGAPRGVLCLEFAGLGGIRSCALVFYLDHLISKGPFQSFACC